MKYDCGNKNELEPMNHPDEVAQTMFLFHNFEELSLVGRPSLHNARSENFSVFPFHDRMIECSFSSKNQRS